MQRLMHGRCRRLVVEGSGSGSGGSIERCRRGTWSCRRTEGSRSRSRTQEDWLRGNWFKEFGNRGGLRSVGDPQGVATSLHL